MVVIRHWKDKEEERWRDIEQENENTVRQKH